MSYDATGIYSVPFGNSMYYNMPQYGAYAAARIPQKTYAASENKESSLAGELLGGGAFMAALQGGPKLIHPRASYNAMLATDKVFRELLQNENFKNLPDAKKMEVYKNLFETERLSSKIANVDKALRNAEETEKILESLKETKSKYIEALKTGNKETAAKCTAEMQTIIAKGKKQGFFTRLFTKGSEKAYDAAKVSEFTTEAGKNAQKAYVAAEAAKAAEGAGLTTTAKNVLKSGGFKGMAVIEGAIETFTEVIPAFELGTDKGIRQIGKSAVTVGASAAGWCAGAAAGGAVGAKVGAAVGSVICPGVGTAVGAAIGLLGGLAGSWLCRKAAKAVVGKSEVEIAEEKKQQQTTTDNPTINTSTQNPTNVYAPITTTPAQNPATGYPTSTYPQIPATGYPTSTFDFYNQTPTTLPFNYNQPSSVMTNPFAPTHMNTPALDLLFNQPIDSLPRYA